MEPSFTVSRETDAGSVFDSGGNFRIDRPLSQDPALAFALGTGIGDDTARALAGRTSARDAEEALLVANLAPAIARTTGDRSFSRRRT